MSTNPTTKPTSLHLDISTITSYEDGIDSFDGPLWYDGMNPLSVQREAEGQQKPPFSPHHHHECASPVERVKHEEELKMETVAALWDSELHSHEVRCKRRRSLLSRSEVRVDGEEEAEVQGEKGEVVAKMCKMGAVPGKLPEGGQCCRRSPDKGYVEGEAVQVRRGAW